MAHFHLKIIALVAKPMMPDFDHPFRLGTRASPLAMAQAQMVRAALITAHGWGDDTVVLVPMVASGDRILDRALADVGGKALWTRELDRALADGKIDASVHSMKDVETLRPPEFTIAAVLPRADVRDRLIGAPSLDTLARGARVGTSSPRRTAQLLRHRPDLAIVLLRGNVGTRLAKIDAGEADATLLAAAGLHRLGMDDVGVAIATDILLPAPAQGAIGIEVYAGRDDVLAAIAAISHGPSYRAIAAERALLTGLGGDCRSPIAALAQADADGHLNIEAELFASDGSAFVHDRRRLTCPDDALTMAADMLAAAPPSVRALFTG